MWNYRNLLIALFGLVIIDCTPAPEIVRQSADQMACGSLKADLNGFLVDQSQSSESGIGWKIPFQYYFYQTPVLDPVNLWMLAYPLSYPFGGYSVLWISPQGTDKSLCQKLRNWKPFRPFAPSASECTHPAECAIYSNDDLAVLYLQRYELSLGMAVKVSKNKIDVPVVRVSSVGNTSEFGSVLGVLKTSTWGSCTDVTYTSMVSGLYAAQLTDADLECLLSYGGTRVQSNLVFRQTGLGERIKKPDAKVDQFFRQCVAGLLTPDKSISTDMLLSSRAQCWRFANDEGLFDVILIEIFPQDVSSIQGDCDRKLAWLTRLYGNSDNLYISMDQTGLIALVDNYLSGEPVDVITGRPEFAFDYINTSVLRDSSLVSHTPTPTQAVTCQDSMSVTSSENRDLYGWDVDASCTRSGRLNTCGQTWYTEHFVDGKTIKLPLVGRWYLPSK